MDTALVSAFSALAGSAIGGLTSGLASLASQRAQARFGMRAHEIERREGLYREFIIAASKAYGEAIMSSEPQVHDLIALYAMISTMRTVSSRATVECAERIMQITVATYQAPNHDVFELHELIRSGGTVDPLKDFSEAARTELQLLARS